MIGVSARATQRGIVAEFFELFKTPWEFCRKGTAYDLVLCTSDELFCEASRLVLIFGSDATAFDIQQKREVRTRPAGFVVSDEGLRLPVYGKIATFPGSANFVLSEEETGEPVGVVDDQESVTTLRIGYDIFDEVRFLLSVGQPSSNATLPTLERHIAFLRNWITLSGISTAEIPPIPFGHKFIACLTHDIDHPSIRDHWLDPTMFGFLYRSTIGTLLNVCRGRKPVGSLWKNWRAAFLLPLVKLGIAEDFWSNFDRYMEIENGLGSTFFVIPRKDHAGRTTVGPAPALRACRYDINRLLPQLKRIISLGCEVGVHGVDAWLDPDEGCKERIRVSQVTGIAELGVRMHWLYLDSNSPLMLERAGYLYDSTMGYREAAGYRAGTTQVYAPLGTTKLLELPLHVMDTALFYPSYLNLREKDARVLVWRLIDEFELFGGVLTINWHDRSIAPERLWEDFYRALVDELRARGAWMPNSSQAVAWFRKRRDATVDVTKLGPRQIRVDGKLNDDAALPDLTIRVNKPRAQSLCDPIELRRAPEFIDFRFRSTLDFKIEI